MLSFKQAAGRVPRKVPLLPHRRCWLEQSHTFLSCMMSTLQIAPQAAVCVIANEVLTGKTLDTNSHWIAKFLFRRGIDLKRVVVIPDEEEAIMSTVKELSQSVGPSGYVFTTGGIGPTHDDITYESVVSTSSIGNILYKVLLLFVIAIITRQRHLDDALRFMKPQWPNLKLLWRNSRET